ncbi:hypothetical protein JHK87_015810 [Glycine soja]|nr:hypothetical protein JHK87_015810 [Glycine soja]
MFVFNSALKGLDDTQQSKSKAAARWIVVKEVSRIIGKRISMMLDHWNKRD